MEFPSSPGNGNALPTNELKAIPITHGGIRYRSTLEFRFAEYLTRQGIKFEHEPSHWNGPHKPDFYLPELSLFVEVKPKKYLHEILREEIESNASQRWICVDKLSRDSWHLIDRNRKFVLDVCNEQFVLGGGLLADDNPIEFCKDPIFLELKVSGEVVLDGLVDLLG